MKRFPVWLILLALVGVAQAQSQETKQTPEYLTGGPLAGIKLPPYPTYHGEPAGRPGNHYRMQYQLYPGSVENYNTYMGKYMPIRSFFDQQSLVQRWIAPSIPGASSQAARGQYAQPIWTITRGSITRTDKVEPPVDTLTFKPGQTIISTTTQSLNVGLYCVRVIAAVPYEQVKQFQDDLFIRLTVNDKPEGQQSNYRVRVGYCDQFYSLVELYFHAPEARPYTFTLSIDEQSKPLDVIVREVVLDDAMVGIVRKPIKTKSNTPLYAEQLETYNKQSGPWQIDGEARQARLDRDAAIWNGYPATNKTWTHFIHRSSEARLDKHILRGAEGKPLKEINEEHGEWIPGIGKGSKLKGNEAYEVLLYNEKLGLKYTFADYNAGKPLPDPFPYKDDGAGVAWPNVNADGKQTTGTLFFEVSAASTDRMIHYQGMVNNADNHLAGKNPNASLTRDALVALVRYAYEMPTYDHFNAMESIVLHTSGYGRNWRNRRRDTPAWFMTWYTEYARFLDNYDKLFPLIQGNEELAQSIGRFIPWVKTSQDVVALLDAYLVQNTAKRIMRYQYHTHASAITKAAAVLGDGEFTRPWMEWQFSRAWAYPMPLGGLQHYMVTGMDRSGIGRGGTSSFYGFGKSAHIYAQEVEEYTNAVGPTPFTLLDEKKYPKVFSALEWPISLHYAGFQYARSGDVSGAEKPSGHLIPAVGFHRAAWRWLKDPRHAAILYYFDKATEYAPEEWKAIEEAAATRTQLPFYEQRSRYLPNWATILETGQQHTDPRFRRGVAIRTGLSVGHSHEDSMDLQVAAHGLTLVQDAGQRPGYAAPSSSPAAVHNTATFDGANGRLDIAWPRTITDNPGIQYTHIRRGEPEGASRGDRQVALIDVSEGKGAASLTPREQKPQTKLPPAEATADSYVMDIFRLGAGRKNHNYYFHAMVSDLFEWNATDLQPYADGEKPMDLSFPPHADNRKGKAPANLVATWRMQRDTNEVSNFGHERNQLGKAFDPNSPPKFLRLHQFEVEGVDVDKAQFFTNTPPKSQMTMIGLSRKNIDPKLGSVFIGLIEPYAGQPIIKQAQSLTIAANEKDWQRAVALKVETVNGHDDLLIADGRPEKIRSIPGQVRFAGAFGYLSKDGQGLRAASITGGTVLESPQIRLKVERAAWTGNITAVDYLNKQITIDQAWPAREAEFLTEIGHKNKATAYTIRKVVPQGKTSVLTTRDGADFFMAPIQDVKIEPRNPAAGQQAPAQQGGGEDDVDIVEGKARPKFDGPVKTTIITSLSMTPSFGSGLQTNWVLSDGEGKQFWRAHARGSRSFELVQDKALADDELPVGGEMRLWEYGVGDQVIQRTTASVTRNDDGSYRVIATADVTLALPGSGAEISTDGQNWSNIGQATSGWVTISLKADQAADKGVLIRIR